MSIDVIGILASGTFGRVIRVAMDMHTAGIRLGCVGAVGARGISAMQIPLVLAIAIANLAVVSLLDVHLARDVDGAFIARVSAELVDTQLIIIIIFVVVIVVMVILGLGFGFR
jgi:hypothetical protein